MEGKRDIGSKIKQYRESLQITRNELSERSGLDMEQITKIEDKQEIPSMGPLIKIARGLGTRLGTFLDDSDQIGPVLVRAGDEHDTISFASQNIGTREHLNFFSLAHDKTGRHMEPFIIDIEANNESNYKLSSHEGEEFIYVLDGEIEINYGKELYHLKKGDSIYLDSIIAHNVHAYQNQSAKMLAVIYIPA